MRDDIDPGRIGLYGVSKGGIETYLTAAVDPRVKVAVPCIGMQSFHWALDNDAWKSRVGTIQNAFDSAAKEAHVDLPGPDFVRQFYARVAPGLDGEFDGPAMAPLIAPRALMLVNGDSDPRTPLPGLKLCTDAPKPPSGPRGRRSFCGPDRREDRPQSKPRFPGCGRRLVRQMAQALTPLRPSTQDQARRGQFSEPLRTARKPLEITGLAKFAGRADC